MDWNIAGLGGVAQPILTYGVIQRGAGDTLWPGINNTNDLPKFMDALGPDGIAGTLDDDLRIKAFSAAIDNGLNSVILPLADVDLAGNPRLSDTRVDSGAYEFDMMAPGSPLLDEDPNFVPKNRYISFQPGQVEAAIAVTLTDSNLFPNLIGQTWWVDDPHPSNPDIFSLGCDMVFIDWSLLEDDVISVADEQIFPDSTYTVQAVYDGGVAGTFPITVITVAPWCDVVGAGDGQGGWTPPNGLVNLNDVSAVVAAFQGNPSAPPLPRSDVEPAVPNAVVNLADAQRVTAAFQGRAYPFAEPSPCP